MVMRGQQTLFAAILPPPKEKQPGIGRNPQLIAKRNTKLIYRYYYYTQLQPHRLDYSYVINTIANEFDLSFYRLIIILQENHNELKQVFAEKLEKKQLQQKFPFLSWQ